MKFLTLASLLASLPAAICALPDDVVAVPLPDTCASYPQYDTETGVAGPWILHVVNSENPAIEGFGNTDTYSVSFNSSTDRKPTLRWGHVSGIYIMSSLMINWTEFGQITFGTRNDIAHRAIRCSGTTLETYAPTDLEPWGEPTNVQWTPLSLAPYPYDAGLMWKITGGLPLKVFEHYIEGVKQDGVFLGGYDNSTTWGFKYYPADPVDFYNLDYYYLRLLGPNSADPVTGAPLGKNETRGFVRVA